MDIFDAVIDWLEKEKAKGRDGLYLSPESKATFDQFLKLSNDPEALAEFVKKAGGNDFVEPVEQIEKVDSIEPVEQTELTEKADSVEPIEQIEPVEEVEPIEEPVAQSEPVAVSEPPIQPVTTPVDNSPVQPTPTPTPRPAIVASEQFQILQSGALNADLMFLGEEMFDVNDQQPFAKSCELLGKMIQAMKFDVNEVSIVSVAKKEVNIDCDNLVKMALDKVISVVKPKVIVVMGALPSKALLGTNDLILNIRGKWLKYGDIQCMPTYHPFYLSRVEARKREAWTDLQQVMSYLGKI